MDYLNFIFWFIGIGVCVLAVIVYLGELVLRTVDFLKRRKENGKKKKIK